MKRGCKAENGYKGMSRKIEQQGEEKCKTIPRECMCWCVKRSTTTTEVVHWLVAKTEITIKAYF